MRSCSGQQGGQRGAELPLLPRAVSRSGGRPQTGWGVSIALHCIMGSIFRILHPECYTYLGTDDVLITRDCLPGGCQLVHPSSISTVTGSLRLFEDPDLGGAVNVGDTLLLPTAYEVGGARGGAKMDEDVEELLRYCLHLAGCQFDLLTFNSLRSQSTGQFMVL